MGEHIKGERLSKDWISVEEMSAPEESEEVKELARLINELGGAVGSDISIFKQEPPFPCSKRVLVRVFAEKLGDPLFRTSIANLAPWLFKGRSMYRIAELLVHKL